MNLSAIIHTFDNYNWLWPGLFESYNKHWRSSDPKLYLGTDIEPTVEVDPKFDVLLSGKGEWSDRLLTLLSKIDTEYVFYAQEDHYLNKRPPNFLKLLEFMEHNRVLRLQTSPENHYYTLENGQFIRYFRPNSKYLVSHQPSIWNRKFFISCLQKGETPWVNEYEGTKRLNKLNLEKRIAILNYDWYDHKCQRGKLI